MTMTKRERVMAALRGAETDRVPLAFWMHNFATENSAEGLAAETLRLARTFDWDYLKPQSRAQCFAEMWGLTYQPSAARARPYTIARNPARNGADLARLTPADPRTGALGEQREALRAIRAASGRDTPIVWTVFSPMMIVPYLLEGGRDQALAIARSEPKAMEAALDAIAETLTGYVTECLDAGADGIFYATNLATRELLGPAECRTFQRPYDLRVLGAAAAAPFNIMHVCGAGTHFAEFEDYPVAAFSWALGSGNPSLAEGHRRSGRAVVGGIPAKPEIVSMSPAEIGGRVSAAIMDTGGRWLLLAPDCSINPDTPDLLLHAARQARDASAGRA
jgi:uroporphyrinogen decarboxylase